MNTRQLLRTLAPFCFALAPACGSSNTSDAGTDTPTAMDVADVLTPSDVSDASDASDAITAADAGDARPALPNVTYVPSAPSRVVEPGVRREPFVIDTPASPANPATNATTPAAQNRVQVIRYRQDVSPPAAVRTIIVAMPGFLGGAGTFDTIARSLVKRGATAGADSGIEVWAIDRRSNLLEDLRGMDAADVLGDPEVAKRYYLDRGITLNGEGFAGFLSATDPAIANMSEWGLATTIEDLHAVISLVPSSHDHVILMGHSLGGSIAEAYSAWDFAGTPGYQTIAGTVLVDGALSGTSLSESEYHNGSPSGFGGMPTPGVDGLRANGPYFFVLPLLGIQAEVVSEIGARRALAAPDGLVHDAFRDRLLKLLLGISVVPPLSNAAAFGFALDDGSNPLAFARFSMGTPAGGPTMTQPDPLGQGSTIVVPASNTAMYTWDDAPAGSATEFTPVAAAAHCWATSPTNYPEWYFPVRLPLDVSVVGNAALDASTWQSSQGILTRFGGAIDVPVLAVGSYFYNTAQSFDGVRTRLSITVGTGRPNAGATRDDPRGFQVIIASGMTHLDPLSGADGNPNNPVPAAVTGFALTNTVGTVSIPVR